MGAARPLLGLFGLGFLAAGVVLQLFVILSGTTAGLPASLTYFLEVSTDGANSKRNPSRWTYWGICSAAGNYNIGCGALVPAHPFDPPRNFGSTDGVPMQFQGTKKFYLLSRFSWVFFLMALIFGALALATGLLALCTRLGAYLSGFNTMIALFWQILAAALMTAWTVEARNIYRSNNTQVSLGRYGYGFTWGAVAALMVSTALFCAGGAVGGKDSHGYSGGKFGRRKSRGSFIDSDSQNRVKEEYV